MVEVARNLWRSSAPASLLIVECNFIGPSEIYFLQWGSSKNRWTGWKIMLYQVSFCPFWNEDDESLSHPRKLQEMFFDTVLSRRNMHLPEQLFSVWGQSHPLCFNTDNCHHSQKSVFSSKCHIAVFMYALLHTYTQMLAGKCADFQLSPSGILALKKQTNKKYSLIWPNKQKWLGI